MPTDRHTRSEKAEKEFVARLRANGYKKHEIDAALGGWEYVLDQCCGPDTHYSVEGMHGSDGSCEAGDMAAAVVEEKPWKPQDRESAADCVYTGMNAAIKFVRQDEKEFGPH